jgi:hypothetical protein
MSRHANALVLLLLGCRHPQRSSLALLKVVQDVQLFGMVSRKCGKCVPALPEYLIDDIAMFPRRRRVEDRIAIEAFTCGFGRLRRLNALSYDKA